MEQNGQNTAITEAATSPAPPASAGKPGGDSPLTLGTRPIGKLLLKYSVPAIIASVAVSLYNIIDSIFIGRGVGAMAIAGLAITFPMMNLVMAFCMLIAAGGAAISSIFMGQGNINKATATVNNVLILCIINAIFFGGLSLIFLDDILTLFGADAQTIPYAREFMRVILLGTPVSFVFIGLNNLMRATGYPRKAMISALLSVIINVILAPIFIYKFKWGIAGAASATLCAQVVSLFWVLWHFMSKKSFIHFRWRVKWFDLSIIKRIYSIGLSPFLMNVTACIVVVFLNKALIDAGGAEGNLAVGAYGILNRTNMLFVMVVFGVTQGMQPILGFNWGAQKWERVKSTLKRGIVIATIITTLGWFVTRFFPDQISELFTTDSRLIKIARDGFHIYFLVYPVVGPQIVIQNYFQSIGKPKLSIFLSLTRQLIFLLPFLMIFPKFWHIDGVWMSMAASDLLAAVVAWITLRIMFHRYLNKNIKTQHQ